MSPRTAWVQTHTQRPSQVRLRAQWKTTVLCLTWSLIEILTLPGCFCMVRVIGTSLTTWTTIWSWPTESPRSWNLGHPHRTVRSSRTVPKKFWDWLWCGAAKVFFGRIKILEDGFDLESWCVSTPSRAPRRIVRLVTGAEGPRPFKMASIGFRLGRYHGWPSYSEGFHWNYGTRSMWPSQRLSATQLALDFQQNGFQRPQCGLSCYSSRRSSAMTGMCMETDWVFQNLPQVTGLENMLVNEVATAESWSPLYAWKFKKKSHINILELSSVLRLVVHVMKMGGHCRLVALTDSSVVRGAVSKGRTSSRGLNAVLRKIGALLVASAVPFVPTRLNVADDPTRDTDVRPAAGGKVASSRDEMFDMAAGKPLKRWAANWVRLVSLQIGPEVFKFRDRRIYRRRARGSSRIIAAYHGAQMDFDKTKGFPGEGPSGLWILLHEPLLLSSVVLGFFFAFTFLWISCSHSLLPGHASFLLALASPLLISPRGSCGIRIVSWISFSAMETYAMPVFPRNPGDKARAAMRAVREPPAVTRPVLQTTKNQREKFRRVFQEWLDEQGIDFDFMLQKHLECIEEINMVLVRFGKALYQAGRPYNHYLETINLVVARKPLLRRMLQTAWDYAFSWVKQEPSAHHVAMPFQVVLACISVAIAWGWDKVAGALALMWGALWELASFWQQAGNSSCFLGTFKCQWTSLWFR